MTGQDNIISGKFEEMSRALTVFTIMAATLVAANVGIVSMNEHGVYGQMMGEHSTFVNKTSTFLEDQHKMKINGTINLEQTIIEAIDSKVNTSLTQAITIAEQSVGNNSFALAAFGADQGGYLTYVIILGTPGTEFHNVIVDPGNGQILSSQRSSQSEIEEKHLAHSTAIVQDAVSGVGSYGLRALRH
jgi:hypothetical protein